MQDLEALAVKHARAEQVSSHLGPPLLAANLLVTHSSFHQSWYT
jgi:hypothetical protein